jgi:beta-N-acetylhexosaminidase
MTKAISELVMVGVAGMRMTDELRRFFSGNDVFGVILYSRNVGDVESLARFISDLKAASRCPLVVGIDQEGGRIARVKEPFTIVPPMAEIGAQDRDGSLAFKTGQTIAKELKSIGVDLNFAPVLDVNTNSKNPIIGDRAFSSDAGVVARLGARFIEGTQGEGVAACGKHFPGHGDTDVDSHLAMPVVAHGMERLRAVEFVPFAAAIEADVASIMTAHMLLSAIDEKNPATISKKALDGLLRGELGYDGLVFTDDLMMKGIADMHAPERSAVMAINAGADIPLVCTDDLAVHRSVIHALEKAYDAGELNRKHADASLRRMKHFKRRYCHR